MFSAIQDITLELGIGFGLFSIGVALFFAGNRLFGRKTGGKRLVIFAAGIGGILLGYFLFRLALTKDNTSGAAVFGAISFTLSIPLLTTAFSSDESVEEAYKTVLRFF